MKAVPKGIQDFKKIRTNGFYYVDKSLMIKEILDSGSEVMLYTRPRRFGKSLNLSMLDAFFNMKYKENSWFDGLAISECQECSSKKNAYPVIYFDMKNIRKADSISTFFSSFRTRLQDLYSEFNYLENSDKCSPHRLGYYRSIMDRTTEESRLTESLEVLSVLLHQYHGVKPIILIDEYDNPIHNAEDSELKRQVIDFMRDLLTPALKGNESFEFAVITGIMQIAKESIFSGLNNLVDNNIFEDEFNESFGFTDEEVKQICTYYGSPDKYDEAKEWYDGYVFGKSEIYNPWSVLSYVKSDFKPGAYWAGTSGNSIINDLLERTDNESAENILKLASGESISMKIFPTLTYDLLDTNTEALYSMLALTGYLKAVPDNGTYLLSVPNKEMYSVYEEMIANKISVNVTQTKIIDFRNAMLSGNTSRMEEILEILIMDILDPKILVAERVYQAFIASLLAGFSGRYDVKTESQGGKGYSDILIRKKYGEGPHVIMELKKASTDADQDHLEKLASEALEQIESRKYAFGLEGKILAFGIAFSGSRPLIVSKEFVQ